MAADSFRTTADRPPPPGVRLAASGRDGPQEERAAVVDARVATLEKQLKVELSLRDGFARLAAQYDGGQNASAKADVMAKVGVPVLSSRTRLLLIRALTGRAPLWRRALARAAPQYAQWETDLKRLSDDLRKFRTYQTILRGVSV